MSHLENETNNSAIVIPSDMAQNEYFEYLCTLVNITDDPDSYKMVAKFMFKTDAYSLLPLDKNREEDGKKIRQQFISKYNLIDKGILEKPCSFLELLIGMCERMAFNVDESSEIEDYGYFFKQMISNCGLDMENWRFYNGEDLVNTIYSRIEKVLDRKYSKNGTGGLFPLKHSDKDQRTIELWYQMQSYLEENI